jgi:exopolysaccharide biosynthesis polyprenyl glycosylphosphotransferase
MSSQVTSSGVGATEAPVRTDPVGDVASRLRSDPSATVLRRESTYRRVVAAGDALAFSLVLWLSAALLPASRVSPSVLLLVPFGVLAAKLLGLYERDETLLRKTTLDEAPRLLHLATLFALATWISSPATFGATMTPQAVVSLLVVLIVVLVAARALSRLVARTLSAPERCLFVGDAAAAEAFRRKLTYGHDIKADLVAAVSLDLEGTPGEVASDLRELVEQLDVHRVILHSTMPGTPAVLDTVRALKEMRVRVSVLPAVMEVVGSSVEVDDVHGLTLLSVRRFDLTRSSQLVKRGFDLVGVTLMLFVLAPVFALLALAVKLDSRGPVLFRQHRVGRGGRPFEMLKFRTMVPSAEAMKADLLAQNEGAEGFFKIDADPRATRVGAWLRRTSLDELPQLLNVVRGEMSLVGPRPLIAEEDRLLNGWSRRRLTLTPGMTGHWQILGGSRVPLREMAALDYLYVANWSLWNDVKILLRTVPYVLGARSR